MTHPDIAYFPRGWRRHKFWLAATPYYFDTDTRENPSILVSDDGATWAPSDGLTNPVAQPPNCDHNSDPDLVYNPATDELFLYYAQPQRSDRCPSDNSNYILLTKSSDGVHWSTPQAVLVWDLAKAPLYVSPAVVYREGRFEMWLASTSGPARATSEDGVNWSAPEPVTIDDAAPWHLDVAYVEKASEYWMLFVDSPASGSALRLATSDDGLAWRVQPEPLLTPGAGWDDERIYRATFLLDDQGRFRVWYSARNTAGEWHIGYTETSAGEQTAAP